ncbi:MAG: hypothetical protein K8R79_10160 [Calditrichales bacterium]|nr:hypothetical protein [Calditrichales bacterium]
MSYSNRLFVLFLFPMVFTVLFNGCSKNNSSEPDPAAGDYLMVYFNGDSTQIFFKDLTIIDAEGDDAIMLSSFVDTTLIPNFEDKGGTLYDARVLYAYQIVSGDDDRFSASAKGYPNNIWSEMQLGYIVTGTRKVVFLDEVDLPNAYNVKNTHYIKIYRKFDIDSLGIVKFSELRDFAVEQVTNYDDQLEDAVPLKSVIMQAVSNPENFSYNLRSLDDYGPDTDMTWTEFQTGYWLLESKRTIFSDTTLTGGQYKLKVLEKILVK